MQTPTPTAPPAPAEPAPLDLLLAQIESFAAGLLTLDPQEAALRAGLTLLVVLGAMLLIWGLRLLLKGLTEKVAPDGGDAAAEKRLQIGRSSLRLARFIVVAAALLAVLKLWGFDFNELARGPLGALFGGVLRIALIVAVALAAIELAQFAITRVFDRIAGGARNPRRAAQIRTLAPLLTGVATTAMLSIAAMTALSEIGVEIGPLIAGAGIVGLAIGFGAQTLVKDFLTGIFLIVEDAVSIGDVVLIGEFGGTVEAMSLRTIKLRDFDGTLHVFPYSEAQVIHNRTKNFSFAVFELPVSHDADIARALELMQETGDAIRADAAFAPAVVAPIEVVGVDRISESGVLLKARIKTGAGKQWGVQREYLQRIRAAFREAGIETPTASIRIAGP